MNNLILRAGALLACALSLSACGGSEGNLYLGGVVVGMTKQDMRISNNGGPEVIINGNATGAQVPFQFEKLEADDRFNIQIVKQPPGSTCVGENNVGKMGGYSVSNVVFRCRNLPRNLSGRLTAPVSYDVVLNNGSSQVKVPAGQTAFTFTIKTPTGDTGTVGDGEPYGVTVLKPENNNCTVQNATGNMNSDKDNVLVTCQ